MKKAVIIDDEQHGADTLAAMLRARFSDRIEIAGVITDSRKAATLIADEKPDIVFMDVEMPHINGIQLMHSFPKKDFSVVFTTAHERYAIQAIKTEAADYLLKPISMDELTETIDKIFAKAAEQEGKQSGTTIQKLLLPAAQGTLIARLADIIRIESSGNYSHFTIRDKPKVTVSKTLKEYEEQLEGTNFFRVHQSHIVNLDFVDYFHQGAEEYLILKNGDRVEVSRRRKTEFLSKLAGL